ncbi:Histone-lysine N-methyltransferase [Zostera marina]|uniref:Histone-lysine N-methyltransferase n=1 Tax=Zostera marina TaxID=29655 RepID=A0A0K9P775_ZOSMR|nr:Histone-lysine N-methyltransferase [Zostera marina]
METEAHLRVKNVIRLYNRLYLHHVQEEEKRCDAVKKARESETSKVKKNSKSRPSKKLKLSLKEVIVKRPSNRPDLKAMTEMKEKKIILYPIRKIGNLAGIEVGYKFYSRCEMVAVGFHQHWLSGIDYISKSYSKKEEYLEYPLPLAVCIVMSGQYEDDVDDSHDVVYTGQGGNDGLGNKRQNGDQQMLRGNLALKNNMIFEKPVRVVRGHACQGSFSGKVYTYDGLYKVVDQWAEKGNSGYTVFRYRLHRLENQSPLTTSQVLFTRSQVPGSIKEIRGLAVSDITQGLERISIPATNVIDDTLVGPLDFEYCHTLRVADNITLPPIASGCKCKGSCTDPNVCACATLNGSDFPYVQRDGGRLIEAKGVVFECGPNCGCDPNCLNRTSQKGLKYRLEVFKTPSKGWAVRSWDVIPSGAPVCEYTGILKKSCDVDNVKDNNYIFAIDCLETIKSLNGRKECNKGALKALLSNASESDYCVDAGSVGNIARFINHSCEPNLFVQCILSSHHDVSMARIVLFAADLIPPLQELTYDYGYALDSVTGENGEIIKLDCFCGAPTCSKRLY